MNNATKIETEARNARIPFVACAADVFMTFDNLDALAAKIGDDKVNELCKGAKMADKGMVWAR